MAQLNQVLAIVKGEKERAKRDLTEAHHVLQKTEPLRGISRVYSPKMEDGDKLPSETTRVQIRAHEVVIKTTEIMGKLFDIVASQEYTNSSGTAKADVVVDGTVLLSGVPVTYLLFLEHQLEDIYTFIRKLPSLDVADTWKYDQAQDCWLTEPTETARTQKIQRPLTMAPATDKHAAQVQLITEDVIAGYWKQIKYSGAFPQKTITTMLANLTKVREAVKAAREAANSVPAVDPKPANALLGFIFAPGMKQGENA